MSRARKVILAGEQHYRNLHALLQETRQQDGLFEVFIRPVAVRTDYQNRHWWALCRNLQYVSGGQHTANQWHYELKKEVLGIDLPRGKDGMLLPFPFSTTEQDPVEFEFIIRSAEAFALALYPDFSLAPHEVAL